MIRNRIRRWLLQRLVVGIVMIAVGLSLFIWRSEYIFLAYKPLPSSPPPGWRDYGLPVLVGGMVLAGIFFLVFSVPYLRHPERHSSLQNLWRVGNGDTLLAAMEGELRDRSNVITFSNSTFLTATWILQHTADKIRFCRLDQIVLVTKIVLGGSQSGVKNSPVRHAVEVIRIYGSSVIFELRERDANRLVIELLARLPWAMDGFNLDHGQKDIDAIRNTVERRREEHQKGSRPVREN